MKPKQLKTPPPHLHLVYDRDNPDHSWMVGIGDASDELTPRKVSSTGMDPAEGGEETIDQALEQIQGKVSKSGAA